MKKQFLFLIIIFTSAFGHAQEAPQKANTIIITFPDSNAVVNKLTKILENKGYVWKKTKNPAVIVTEPKTLKNTRILLNAEVKGPDVLLSGKIVLAGQTNMNIENKGREGASSMNAWEEMNKVAKAFGVKLRYEIK
jgi:hypothetical protein